MKRVLASRILPSWRCRAVSLAPPLANVDSYHQQLILGQVTLMQQRFIHFNHDRNQSIVSNDFMTTVKRCHSQMSRKTEKEFGSSQTRRKEKELDSILKTVNSNPQALDLDGLYDFLYQYAAPSNKVNVNSMVNIIQQYLKSPGGDQLTVRAYNSVLRAYDTLQQIEKAEKLYEWLKNHKESRFHPNSQTYHQMITIYKNSGEPAKALEILDQFYQEWQKGEDGTIDSYDVVKRHFNSVLAAWLPFAKEDPAVPSMVDEVLNKLQGVNADPDEFTMNTIITLFVRRGDPEKAEEMFRRMQQEYNIPANTSAFTTLMSSWYQKREYDHVQRLFDEFQQLYQASPDNESIKPNANIYFTLMHAKANVGEAEKVAQLLNEWIQLNEAGIINSKPKTREFGAVVQAWLKSDHPDASMHAEKGLRQMLELYESGQFDSFPDVMVFTAVITAHGRVGKGHRAFPLFQKLLQLTKQYPKNKRLLPDFKLYQKVIYALSRSKDPRASEKVEYLLMDLLDKDNSFWTHNITGALDVINITRRTLEGSTLERRHKLLGACDRLERVAKQRGAR